MKTLNIPDMHCGKCVARIEAAFAEDGIPCTVALETQTVAVAEADVARATETLDDLGFTVAE